MRFLISIFLFTAVLSADEKIQKSIDMGVVYLLRNQNPDGSWGTAGRTKSLNIYAPGPGAHLDFRTAVTALDLLALSRLENKSPSIKRAIERSTAFLIERYPEVKRVDGRWVGNTWSHAYIIKAFLKVRELDFMKDQKSALDKVIQHQIEQLKIYQYLDGGWGYYDFMYKTSVPSGKSTSFLIGTILIILKEAKDKGFDVDEKSVKKAIGQLKKQRRPDGNFLYSFDFKFYTGRNINKTQGSLARVHGCLRALHDWEDPVAKNADFDQWLERLVKLNGWLDIVRKRPVPHEGWYQIAGYLYYFGHFYATENLKLAKDKKKHASAIAEILTSKQELTGAWFDFPLYDYGYYYGTAYVLMSLIECQKVLEN